MLVPYLKEKYYKEIIPALQRKLGYSSPMQVPRLSCICINQGLGEAKTNPKILDFATKEIASITGQQPVLTKAKKSISNLKLREGMKIGARVTLRRDRMYEFFYRLIMLALPQGRDFNGLNPKSFDGRGNYTIGIKEQTIFPEISIDTIDKTRGMNITFVTSAKEDKAAYALLEAFGMPFQKRV